MIRREEEGGYVARCEATAGYRRDYYTTIGRSGRHFCYYTSTDVNRTVSSEGMYCANAFRTGRRNSSFPPKCCACAADAFLSGIISWSVYYMVCIKQDTVLEYEQYATNVLPS
jgi:hypothetical protein